MRETFKNRQEFRNITKIKFNNLEMTKIVTELREMRQERGKDDRNLISLQTEMAWFD